MLTEYLRHVGPGADVARVSPVGGGEAHVGIRVTVVQPGMKYASTAVGLGDPVYEPSEYTRVPAATKAAVSRLVGRE